MTAKSPFPPVLAPQFLSLFGHSSFCTCLGNVYSSFHCLSATGERGRILVTFPISFIHSLHDKTHDTHDKASPYTDQFNSASFPL